MIYRLFGKILSKKPSFVVLDVSGVGYKVLMADESLKNIGKMGDSLEVFCSFSIKQDGAVMLLGFLSELELEVFDLLNTVNGIGPKSAMAILGNIKIPELMAAIESGNSGVLKKISGIGQKTAERMVLELKDKTISLSVKSGEIVERMERDSDLEAALADMGYKKGDIKTALSKIDIGVLKLEDRLRLVLKILQKK